LWKKVIRVRENAPSGEESREDVTNINREDANKRKVGLKILSSGH